AAIPLDAGRAYRQHAGEVRTARLLHRRGQSFTGCAVTRRDAAPWLRAVGAAYLGGMGERSGDGATFRIANATVVLPDKLVPGGASDVENSRISRVDRLDVLPRWDGATVDARGMFAAPGYVDMHIHGGGGGDFMDGSIESFETVVAAHTRHGVTSIVATS